MPGLIFDYDGLIVDSERVLADCLIEMLAAEGVTVAVTEFGHLFGSTEVDAMWAELVTRWRGPEATLADFEAQLTPLVRPRVEALPLQPGVLDLLEAARGAGWRIGLGTGQSRARLPGRLERLGIADSFDAVVTSAEVACGKPAPDIFLEVAARLGVRPTECVVLEDSVPGCAAALAAGMSVIVCPSAVSAHCEFPRDVVRVQSLTEVALDELLPLRS
jgi:HAD superfamily hydrolase (TIGR01509 family)